MKTDNVNHPSHYADHCSIECFDAMKAILGYEGIVYFCFGNMFKYLWRHKFKNGAEDIKKATWYSAKAVECISEIEDTDFITAGRLSDIGNPLMDILEKADKEYPPEKEECKCCKDDKKYDPKDIIRASNSHYGSFLDENPTFTFNNFISDETLEKWKDLMDETFGVKELKKQMEKEDKEEKDTDEDKKKLQHADDNEDDGETIQEVIDSMSEKQKIAMYAVLGAIEDNILDAGLDEMLEKIAGDYNKEKKNQVNYIPYWDSKGNYHSDVVIKKEEKNDAKDESPSKAEETLDIICNVILNNNDTENAYKIAKIHGILGGYYADRIRSDS